MAYGGCLSYLTIIKDTLPILLGVESAFIVAGSLEKPTKERWGMATSRALSLCLVLEAACGIAGYLAFLEKTQGDVLNNFLVLGGSITKAANLARGLLCTTMFFVYPVDSFVCRHVLVVLFFRGRRAHEGDDASVLNRRDRRIAMTLIIYFSSLIPALFVESVGSVLAITGTIAGSSLSYIGPGMIYLAVYGDEFLKKVEEVWGKFDGSTDTAPAETDVESSRLLTTQQPNETTTTTESAATEQSFFKSVAWYLLLMPIWCEVAKMGKTKLKEFKEKEALKSPHINRLGKVARPSLQMVPANIPRVGSADGGKMPKFPTPKYGATAGGNKAIGAAILAQQRSASVRAASPAPADLDEPPTWYDFCVAIFFVVFGTIAMCAGMFSILTAK
eukprot:scaffold25558_cov131-Skeletonema_dohrnii-CCMP3373.AAC.1